MLEPGAVEYLEVTYKPVNPATTSTATLTIASDAGTQTVSLEGMSPKPRRIDDDPTSIVTGGGTVRTSRSSAEHGIDERCREAVAAAAGVSFSAVVPNPARDRAELVYALAQGGDVRLGLYDGAGRLVRELAGGVQSSGEHRVIVDVSDLAAGVYHCRLSTAGVELARTVVVVK